MGAEPIGAPHSYNRVVPCLNLAPWLDGRQSRSYSQSPAMKIGFGWQLVSATAMGPQAAFCSNVTV